MIYLKSFRLPDAKQEENYFLPSPGDISEKLEKGDFKIWQTTHDSCYPFLVFRYRNVPTLEFSPITVLYGGNGSGKSTILNVLAEKLGISRASRYNKTDFFDDYVELCRVSYTRIPRGSKMIASDDIFDYLLSVRHMNEDIDAARSRLFEEYNQERERVKKGERIHFSSMDDYMALQRRIDFNTKTASRYVNERLARNVEERSNGESAMKYFVEEITENRLYLLDEPENSLSPKFQLELKKFIEDSARFFKCQFVIATHSPFLLAAEGAAVYDLDSEPPAVKRWTELENVRVYYEFFRQHGDEINS